MGVGPIHIYTYLHRRRIYIEEYIIYSYVARQIEKNKESVGVHGNVPKPSE